jgi:hypothetical protein
LLDEAALLGAVAEAAALRLDPEGTGVLSEGVDSSMMEACRRAAPNV